MSINDLTEKANLNSGNFFTSEQRCKDSRQKANISGYVDSYFSYKDKNGDQIGALVPYKNGSGFGIDFVSFNNAKVNGYDILTTSMLASKFKYTTVTRTTNAQASANININASSILFQVAAADNNPYIVVPFLSGEWWYAKVYDWTQPATPVTNTSITFSIWYYSS